MKADFTTTVYRQYGIRENHHNVNKTVKAVIINFGDDRGDIIVTNDNFGTRRKYADFTEGKKAAGLHPWQIVFSGIEAAKIMNEKYINEKDEICYF